MHVPDVRLIGTPPPAVAPRALPADPQPSQGAGILCTGSFPTTGLSGLSEKLLRTLFGSRVSGLVALLPAILSSVAQPAVAEEARSLSWEPSGIAVAQDGSLVVADSKNHVIKRVDREGVVTLVAGVHRSPGSNDGPLALARFNDPRGVAIGPEGTIFVADSKNHLIRKIGNDGTVTTLAGTVGTAGVDDGEGSNATFYWPRRIAADSDGNLYVAGSFKKSVRRITSGGRVDTIPESIHDFTHPAEVAVGVDGSLYVMDQRSQGARVVRISRGKAEVYAGDPSAIVFKETLSGTACLSLGPDGILLIAHKVNTESPEVLSINPTSSTFETLRVNWPHHLPPEPVPAAVRSGEASWQRFDGFATSRDGVIFAIDRSYSAIRRIEAGQVTTFVQGKKETSAD